METSEINTKDDADCFEKRNNRWVVKSDCIENYAVAADDYQSVSTWAKSYIDSLMTSGVLRGVKVKEKYYIPTAEDGVSNTDSMRPFAQIAGGEALGLALFYYDGSVKNNELSYGGYSRSQVYDKAFQYFNQTQNLQSFPKLPNGSTIYNLIKTASDNDTIFRYEAFLIIAVAVQRQSSKRVALENYSSTKLGYMADNQTLVRGYTISNDGTHYVDGKPLVDYATANAQYSGTYQMMAANLLMDAGVMRGRTYSANQNKSEIAFDGYLTYNEFYKLLYTVKNSSIPSSTPYSKVDAALTMAASSKPISYRKFLDGGNVTMTVTMDSGETKSGLKGGETYDYQVNDGEQSKTTKESWITAFPAPVAGFGN